VLEGLIQIDSQSEATLRGTHDPARMLGRELGGRSQVELQCGSVIASRSIIVRQRNQAPQVVGRALQRFSKALERALGIVLSEQDSTGQLLNLRVLQLCREDRRLGRLPLCSL